MSTGSRTIQLFLALGLAASVTACNSAPEGGEGETQLESPATETVTPESTEESETESPESEGGEGGEG